VRKINAKKIGYCWRKYPIYLRDNPKLFKDYNTKIMEYITVIDQKKINYIKLACLLISFTSFSVLTIHASSISDMSEKISTVQIQNKTLKEVFSYIEKNSSYIFINEEAVDLGEKINVDISDKSVEEIINEIFSSNGFSYVIKGRQIIVKKEKTADLLQASRDERKISGTILDSDSNPLIGATIVVKGIESIGTVSDIDGKFELKVPTPNGTIQVSYIGFESQEIRLEPGKSVYQIVLQSDSEQLSEVVVTALGLKREEKKLGYAQQTLNTEQLSTPMAGNWSSALKGKVAGLNVTSGATGPINSQKIQLRGASSLNPGGNYALIVIDGVPMNQESVAYGSNVGAAYGTDAPVDFGNAVSELNLQDIDNITVLKGPSAAALYGSRAANGVLIITTKSGQQNQKIGITYNTSLTFDEINNWPDYQYEYGAGGMSRLNDQGKPYYSWGNSEDGASTNTPEAFGPKFDGQYYYQYDPETQSQGKERTLWRPYKNNMKDFFRTGTTFENAVTLQGGDEKGSMRVNITHTNNKYITPNTGYAKTSVAFNGNYQISDRIKLATVINYNNRNSDNLPAYGMSNGSLGYFLMFLMPSVDINWYKPIWQRGREKLQQLNPFSDWSSNPYFLMYEETNGLKSNQFIGNLRTDIHIIGNLNFIGRISINSLNQLRETHRGYSSQKYAQGYYGRQDVANREINADFMFTYENDLSDNFHYNLMFGGNYMSYDRRNIMSSATGLITPSVYKLSNGINAPLVQSNDMLKQINSLYGMLSLSYKNFVFLDVTGRNDWSSTLPNGNNSYFYPSVASSFILSDIFTLPDEINYLKYRLSFAQVGSDATPYQTSKYYAQSSFISSASVPSAMYNPQLKPEITSSWETGLEISTFGNRLGADITLYSSNTRNQILTLPSDVVSGYSSRVINSGEIANKGIELVLRGHPITNADFDWEVVANWSTNHNEVLSLTDNLEQQTLNTVWQGHLIATVGGTTTDLWGTKFIRDPQGNIVYQNGVPTWTTTPEYIGNTSPDWKAGLTNNFNYKNFRLSVTIDGQFGGKVFSGTYNRASWAGTLSNTLPGREEGTIIGEGVVLNEDGTYSTNTTPINTQTYYTQYHQVTEPGVFSGSFIKLREVSLGYSFPKRLISNLGLNNLSLNVFGRNLAVIDKYPMFDPEAGTLNGTNFVQGLEMASMPSTASYGFKLNVEF